MRAVAIPAKAETQSETRLDDVLPDAQACAKTPSLPASMTFDVPPAGKPVTRIALFGAAPDTPNRGVSALFMSAVTGISRYIENVEFVVFDNGLGRRDAILDTHDGRGIPLIRFGARGGRRYHRPENLAAMRLASRLGAQGARLNEGIRLIDSCDAVLDVSGGDSFSDIYGRERFDNIHLPKAIALSRGKPLILLPQTYGPYKNPAVRNLAARTAAQACMAWARDPHSHAALRDLLGKDFNPLIHRCGVDMAFSLPATPALQHLQPVLRHWLEYRDADHPLLGFNVSGLIYNDPAGASKKYGLKTDYRQAVTSFLQNVLQDTPARVILVSHVMDRPGHYESDLAACMDIAKRLGERHAGRVEVAPATLNESEAKWLIAAMDWFCGTRMHSTIAGLSSGVPTAAVSYSDKTKGVFETCGQGAQVMDPRLLTADEIRQGLMRSFDMRDATRNALRGELQEVMAQAERQLKSIAGKIRG